MYYAVGEKYREERNLGGLICNFFCADLTSKNFIEKERQIGTVTVKKGTVKGLKKHYEAPVCIISILIEKKDPDIMYMTTTSVPIIRFSTLQATHRLAGEENRHLLLSLDNKTEIAEKNLKYC